MPEPAGVAAAESKTARARRPDADTVRSAVRQALGRAGDRAPSQAALRRLLLPILRDRDPAFSIGGRRMRTLLLDTPGIRVQVRYREAAATTPITECPVCGAPVRPITNRTLYNDRVVLGHRCTRCAYWTHAKRRVPVRYAFIRVGRARSRPA